MNLHPYRSMTLVALVLAGSDQLTKFLVVRWLSYPNPEQFIVIPGFFRFVHWANTGAAWSMFYGNNELLAVISVIALGILIFSHHHFSSNTLLGQVALGLVFGGILGNLIDRVRIGHVTDFLRFDLYQRGGGEIGFPAFNIADSAICTGVGLLFIISLRNESKTPSPQAAASRS